MTRSRTHHVVLLVLGAALLLPGSALAQLPTESGDGPSTVVPVRGEQASDKATYSVATGVVGGADTGRDKAQLAPAGEGVVVADSSAEKPLIAATDTTGAAGHPDSRLEQRGPSTGTLVGVSGGNAFAWTDAGVGLAGGLAIGLALVALTLLVTRAPHRRMVA
jgi:hypothetical protein